MPLCRHCQDFAIHDGRPFVQGHHPECPVVRETREEEAVSSTRVPPKLFPVRFGVSLVLPVTVVSEMNWRGHWGSKKRRGEKQRDALSKAVEALGWYSAVTGYAWPFGFPVVATFTRFHLRGSKMDDDNIRAAFKAIRDEVAYWAGVDDGGDQIEWRYAQLEGKPGVEVRIEGAK